MAEPLLNYGDNQDDGTRSTESAGFLMEGVTDVSSLSDESTCMSTMKRVLTREGTSSDIHLLVVGRTGQGKSTLINSLIELAEEVAEEGAESDICTKSCHSYIYPELLPGVRVRIVDSPGLQDIYANEQQYIQEMKSQCQEVSLVLYCIKMPDHRISNDDKSALRKLNRAFGPGFWKRVLFVLTFANNHKCDQRDNRDEDGPEPPYSDEAAWENLIRQRFVNRVKRRGADINTFLKQDLKIDGLIQFVPAGHYKPSYSNCNPKQLPDRGDWLYDMIELIHSQIKQKKFSKLNLNDKIHLAFIVDNHGEVKIEKDGTKTPNDDAKDAQKFKETLEELGFCALYFNSLSSQSISTLLEMLLHVDHSQLATFAFIVLCKGKSRHLYDCNDKRIETESVFGLFPDDQSPLAQVPKIFYFHLVHTKEPKEKLQFLSVPRKNSVALITSVDQKSSSVVLNTVGTKLKNEPSIQQCCKEIDEECNRRHDKVSCVYISNFTDKFVLPAPFEPFHPRAKKEHYKKQLQMYHSMWYPIRCKTINVLSDSKDAVLTTVRNERIGRIAASLASVAGGGLVITGLALIPFTLGGSLVLSVAGSAVGGGAALGGIGAFAASAISTNKHLKSAQEHISLDQQLSQSINVVAKKYDDAVIKCNESALERGELAGNVVAGGAHGLANLSRVGVGIAFGIEAAAEAGAVALRAGARAVGVVLAGASLAVTVPIDLGFIIYNSYQIHQSSKDKTGKADKNKAIQWFIKRIEDMLKDTCATVELQQHTIKGGKTLTIEKADSGYEMIVPAPTEEESVINIHTIFSGPFVLPDGYTIVSAIYDVVLPENLLHPVTFKLEHCIDLNDKVTASKMCFAVATIDLEKKVFEFKCIEVFSERAFPIGETYASLEIGKSCLVCVLYRGSTMDTLMKYAAQCSYSREYKNCWTMSIQFTKCLNAHLKYVHTRSESVSAIESCPFQFKKREGDEQLLMGFRKIKDPLDLTGWRVSPLYPIPDKILKADVDCVELQQEFWKLQSRIIPSIEFSVFVFNEEAASDELDKYLDIDGTTTDIYIKIQKE